MVQCEENLEENECTGATKSPLKTRSDRMAQEQDKYERIMHYIRHGKNQEGLTNNQQRIVRRQAKSYFFDETSKILKSIYVDAILVSLVFSLLNCRTY